MLRMASILLLISAMVLPAASAARPAGNGEESVTLALIPTGNEGPASAQRGGRGGRGGGQIQMPRAQPEMDGRLVPTPESQQEVDAANAIDAEESLLNRLTMIEAFLTDYPESEFTHQILLGRLQVYIDLNNNQEILTAGEAYTTAANAFFDGKVAEIEDPGEVRGFTRFEGTHFQNLTFAYQSMMSANSALNRVDETARYGDLAFDAANETWNRQSQILESGSPGYEQAEQRQHQAQVFFLQTVMSAYQNANDAEKTVEYAERALALDPQNLATLLTISSVMAERPPENEGEREEHFESAEEYAERALDVLERFLDAAGSQLGAQQSASLLSNVHFTLGTVYLNQEEYGDAIDEFEEALESTPTDAVAYLRLGMAYARDEEAEDAMEALARAVFLNGPDQARDLLEQIYEATNENLTGLDAFVQNQGEEIGR